MNPKNPMGLNNTIVADQDSEGTNIWTVSFSSALDLLETSRAQEAPPVKDWCLTE